MYLANKPKQVDSVAVVNTGHAIVSLLHSKLPLGDSLAIPAMLSIKQLTKNFSDVSTVHNRGSQVLEYYYGHNIDTSIIERIAASISFYNGES